MLLLLLMFLAARITRNDMIIVPHSQLPEPPLLLLFQCPKKNRNNWNTMFSSSPDMSHNSLFIGNRIFLFPDLFFSFAIILSSLQYFLLPLLSFIFYANIFFCFTNTGQARTTRVSNVHPFYMCSAHQATPVPKLSCFIHQMYPQLFNRLNWTLQTLQQTD